MIRLMRMLPVLLPGLLWTACENDPAREAGPVEGTWEVAADSLSNVYLRIANGEIDVFTENTFGGCYERMDYVILDVDGIDFRITNGPDTFSIELRRDEDELRVAAFDDEEVYVASTVNPETLGICAPPQPTEQCDSLPVIGVGTELDGVLDATDPANQDGSRYDLYALTVDLTTAIEVTMSSSEVDSRLLLYDSTGALLDSNDDASNRTLNAKLEPTLAPGCHIVMATSAGPAEFGPFTLDVALPEP